MSSIVTFFRVLSLVSSLSFLIGCGGSSVAINERAPGETPVSAQPLLEKIEANLQSSEAVSSILAGLTRPEAFRFDWRGFWNELSQRSYRNLLYARHKEDLRSLHLMSCDCISEYSEFLLSVRGDLGEITGAHRHCANPIRPQIAWKIVKARTENADASPELLVESMNFLVNEFDRRPHSADWATTVESNMPYFEGLGRRLIESNQAATYLAAAKVLQQHIGYGVMPPNFLNDLMDSETLLFLWLNESGDEGATSLHSLCARTKIVPTEKQNQNILQALSRYLDENSDYETLGLRIGNSIHLIKQINRLSPLRTRLSLIDAFLSDCLQRIEKIPNEQKETILLGWTKRFVSSPSLAYFYYLTLVGAPQSNAARTYLKSMLSTAGGFLDLEDVVTQEVNNILALDDIEERTAHTLRLCDVFRSVGIEDRTLRADELNLELEAGLKAGCYKIVGQAAEISSQKPLRTEYSAVLLGSDISISLKAPSIKLGVVHLATTRIPDRLADVPTSPADDAVAIPLLIGISVDKDTVHFARGTHFFVYHYTYRTAANGSSEERESSRGFDGPSVTLDSSEATRHFAFVSVGGPGQGAANPRAGGKGDSSAVDPDALAEWISILADDSDLKILRPVRLEAELNLTLVEELFNQAMRDADGAIVVHHLPGYLEQMFADDKLNVAEICEAEGGGAAKNAADLDKFYREKILAKAIKDLDATVNNSRKDNSIDRSEFLRSLNPSQVFVLPGGTDGPRAADGAQGKSGRLIQNLTPTGVNQ